MPQSGRGGEFFEKNYTHEALPRGWGEGGTQVDKLPKKIDETG